MTAAQDKCHQIWGREKAKGRVTIRLTEWRKLIWPCLQGDITGEGGMASGTPLPSPSPEGPGALGMAKGWKGLKPGPGLDLQGPLPCLCSQASPLLPSQERGKPSSEEIEPESIGLRDAICINR